MIPCFLVVGSAFVHRQVPGRWWAGLLFHALIWPYGIVGATFLTLLNQLGPGNTFFLYGAMEALFFVFFLYFVPETKGVSLEQIAANLMAGKPLREIGNAEARS